MEIATLAHLKKELNQKSSAELVQICLRLARFKKDNKELLNYLIFEAFDEESYKMAIKEELSELFQTINLSSVYYAKKTIRKNLRWLTKQIRYSGQKQTEVELLIFFCQEFRQLSLPFSESRVLMNLYERQLKTIEKSLKTLPEDLQFDYQSEVDEINAPLPR